MMLNYFYLYCEKTEGMFKYIFLQETNGYNKKFPYVWYKLFEWEVCSCDNFNISFYKNEKDNLLYWRK